LTIIEKTYKHVVPSAREFVKSFQEKYSKSVFPENWNDNPAWTKLIFDIFGEMGRGFGYKPRKEYLDIDMVWAIRHQDVSAIAVALEHDNGDLNDVIDDELQKLLDTKAYLKVLMFYPGMPIISENEVLFPEVVEKIKSARMTNPEESYLLITPVLHKDKDSQPTAIEVFAYSFSPSGKWEDLGSFSIDYKGKAS